VTLAQPSGQRRIVSAVSVPLFPRRSLCAFSKAMAAEIALGGFASGRAVDCSGLTATSDSGKIVASGLANSKR